MTPARAWYLIAKSSELVCHPSTLKTLEREKVAYFSDAALITPAFVACSRNAAGKAVIEKLNQFIGTVVAGPANRQRMMDWLDKREAVNYEKDYLEYFKIAH
ncbi:MAG: hypothetical protein V7765_08240 [Oleispira sp.]